MAPVNSWKQLSHSKDFAHYSFFFILVRLWRFAPLACIENCQTMETSDYFLIEGPDRIFPGPQSEFVCSFPSVIADNDGSVILNHLIFTAGTSPTEASWLMSGLRPNHPVLPNHESQWVGLRCCVFSQTNRRWWHIEQTEEMKREPQVGTETA